MRGAGRRERDAFATVRSSGCIPWGVRSPRRPLYSLTLFSNPPLFPPYIPPSPFCKVCVVHSFSQLTHRASDLCSYCPARGIVSPLFIVHLCALYFPLGWAQLDFIYSLPGHASSRLLDWKGYVSCDRVTPVRVCEFGSWYNIRRVSCLVYWFDYGKSILVIFDSIIFSAFENLLRNDIICIYVYILMVK